MRTSTSILMSLMLSLPTLSAFAADEDVKNLQARWEIIKYEVPATDQEPAYATLAYAARAAAERDPRDARVLIWKGIVLSSWAGARGGIKALPLVREARAALEQALAIDDRALAGSGYTSLGALYAQVPGWPIGFGDKDKARALLEKAIAINPDGIDANYFYADFLFRQKDYPGALAALDKAFKAPPRPDRPFADEGRRRELKALQAEIRKLER